MVMIVAVNVAVVVAVVEGDSSGANDTAIAPTQT